MTQVAYMDDVVAGEIPVPLQYQFLQDGLPVVPLVITGYQAKVNVYERVTGFVSISNAAATVSDGPNGKVTYQFTGAEFPTPGKWVIQVWVGNGTQRFASIEIRVKVHAPVAPVPAI